MTALDTIEHTKRLLEKLPIACKNSVRQDVKDNAVELLCIARSIPDHLLEDANKKFNLRIELNQNIRKKFQETDGKAKEFYDWFKLEVGQIEKNEECKAVTFNRNISVHRTGEVVGGRMIEVTIAEPPVQIHGSVSVTVRRKNGEIEHIEGKQEPPSNSQENGISSSSVVFDVCFKNPERTKVISAVETYLSEITRVVEIAYRKYNLDGQ